MKSTTELVYPIIALAIIILVIATAAIPSIQNSSDVTTATTLSNSDVIALRGEYGHYWDRDAVIVLDGTNASTVNDVVITVNGRNVIFNLSNLHPFQEIVQASNLLFILQSANATNAIGFWYSSTVDQTMVPLNTVCTITYAHGPGTVTMEYDDVSITLDSSWFWSLDETGNYGYINTSTTSRQVYFPEDVNDPRYLVIGTGIGTLNNGARIRIQSNIEGIQYYSDSDDIIKVDLVLVDGELVDGYTNIYTNGLLNYRVTTESGTEDVQLGRYYVLDTVQGNLESSDLSNLVVLIPLLLILIPIMLAVRMIGYRD